MPRRRNRSTALVAVLMLVGFAACADNVTAPDEWAIVQKHCLLKGDTIGLIAPRNADGVTVSCIWLLSDKTICDRSDLERYPVPTCVVGQRAGQREGSL